MIFRNARVVDPAQATLLEGLQTVIVNSGKIHAVHPEAMGHRIDDRLSYLSVVDLDGKYICP